jgi:hypothetical protein
VASALISSRTPVYVAHVIVAVPKCEANNNGPGRIAAIGLGYPASGPISLTQGFSALDSVVIAIMRASSSAPVASPIERLIMAIRLCLWLKMEIFFAFDVSRLRSSGAEPTRNLR